MNVEFLSFYSVPLWLFSLMFVIFSLEVLNIFWWLYSSVFDISDGFQFSSVVQSCPTLRDPMDCSTPGFPGHHQFPELTQIHVRWVSDAIKPSHLLSSPFPPTFNLSQHQGLFQQVSLHQVAKVLEFQLQHQSFQWIFRTDAAAEIPKLWPLDEKNWPIWKDLDAGKDWRWEEKGMTEDEMVGWHHRLNGHEF